MPPNFKFCLWIGPTCLPASFHLRSHHGGGDFRVSVCGPFNRNVATQSVAAGQRRCLRIHMHIHLQEFHAEFHAKKPRFRKTQLVHCTSHLLTHSLIVVVLFLLRSLAAVVVGFLRLALNSLGAGKVGLETRCSLRSHAAHIAASNHCCVRRSRQSLTGGVDWHCA